MTTGCARRIVLPLVAAALGALFPDGLAAAPPWQRLIEFKRVEADPNKSYPLTESNGPWLIMAVTFSGDHAAEQARDLVQALRSEYKLPAYTHRMRFDYSDGTEGRGIDRFGRPKRMRYRVDDIDEIAVLVGDYPTVDYPEARKTLEKIKYLKPRCLDPEYITSQGETISRPLASWRMIQQMLYSDSNEKKQKGPMGHAFIIANPLLPQEYFRPKGLDSFVVELNKPFKYSLLTCTGQYTVKVATFTGTVVIDQKKIREIESGKDLPSHLEQAGVKAHKLTEALRAKGYEAYEFHDRSSSIVCVGSFDSYGTPRADGKIEINPQMHKIMETFGAEKTVVPGQPPQVGKPKQVGGMFLDVQPMIVEVPRASLVVDYTRQARND